MRVWTVHASPPSPRGIWRAVLLRDGFSWGALLVPTPWFLANRLFALALLHLALVLVVGALLPGPAGGFVILGVQVFLGFEARALQGWWLGIRGWQPAAVVVGPDEETAFLRLAEQRPDLAFPAA